MCACRLPHESVTAVIHVPLLSLVACGFEPGGICLCANKTRCTKGQSRFALKKKSVYMRSAHAAFLPCRHLRASPSAPWIFQFSVASNGSLLCIPSHESLFAMTAISRPSLMSAFGLLPSFDVMGFWSVVWKESPLGIRPLSVANGLLLVAWAQLHFFPFKLQGTLKCSFTFLLTSHTALCPAFCLHCFPSPQSSGLLPGAFFHRSFSSH